jgi:hypothetical protein
MTTTCAASRALTRAVSRRSRPWRDVAASASATSAPPPRDRDASSSSSSSPSSSSSRRSILLGTVVGAATATATGVSLASPPRVLAAALGSVRPAAEAVGGPLLPLADYVAALDAVAVELAAVASELRDALGDATSSSASASDDGDFAYDDPELAIAAPLASSTRAALKSRLHANALGAFWVTARGLDRYLSSERSPFARDREDLWKLLPEKTGPLGRALQPDFNNPDDPLCLVYSCVNDPRSPPSIDVLYALKLLDEGLATKGVTARGLLGNGASRAI